MKHGLLIAAAGVLLAGGPSCSGTGINRGDISVISVSEEWALGTQLQTDIAKEMRILDDPAIDAYITRCGRMILDRATGDTPLASQPWTFHVVDDASVNAFNIPGGHVYFNSGLVARASDFAELMGVMGHEVSHGLARHGVENLTKQYGIGVLVSLALGSDPAAYQEILANILAGGAVMKFSRGAENEADELGTGYMVAAGVDPQGMVDFFRVLLELRQSRPSSLEQFFSSHPLTEDRIAHVQSLISGLPTGNLRRNDDGFAAFQSAVARAAGS